MLLTCSRYLFLPSSVLTTCLCTRLALLANELAISCYGKAQREELGYSSNMIRIICLKDCHAIIEETAVISHIPKLFLLNL